MRVVPRTAFAYLSLPFTSLRISRPSVSSFTVRRLATMTQSSAPQPPKIGTHDGTFHCDEALACHMLRTIPRYSSSPIIRTRDTSILSTLDVIVDVGGEYNPETLRFDHHQRGFSTAFTTDGPRSQTKLSSAGLIYKHFGRHVIAAVLGKEDIHLSSDDRERVYGKVYDAFVEAVDAVDNGIPRFESDKPARYDSSTDLSSRVARLNAEWWEKDPNQDANFMKAVALTGTELNDCITRVARSWLPARAIVVAAMKRRKDDDDSGNILVMREWAPWKEHLYEIEREEQTEGQVLYVVYKDMTGRSWRVQCVPVEKASFESRKPLPEAWRGMRDEELSKMTGIPKCVFVHASGFIGGNQEFEGAMQMARKALEMG